MRKYPVSCRPLRRPLTATAGKSEEWPKRCLTQKLVVPHARRPCTPKKQLRKHSFLVKVKWHGSPDFFSFMLGDQVEVRRYLHLGSLVFWQGGKPPLELWLWMFEIQGGKHRGTLVGIYEDRAASIWSNDRVVPLAVMWMAARWEMQGGDNDTLNI